MAACKTAECTESSCTNAALIGKRRRRKCLSFQIVLRVQVKTFTHVIFVSFSSSIESVCCLNFYHPSINLLIKSLLFTHIHTHSRSLSYCDLVGATDSPQQSLTDCLCSVASPLPLFSSSLQRNQVNSFFTAIERENSSTSSFIRSHSVCYH